MRVKKTKTGLLAVLLTLTIICAFLVPTATVTAAPPQPQNWPLQLVGATTINITQAQFEAMAAANPSEEFTDPSTGHAWKGVALWRLIALVDDGDSATFNDALASMYSIRFTGLNNDGTYYVSTFAPPFAVAFPHAENVFVANKVKLAGTTEWVDLPLFQPGSTTKLAYPLWLKGSGITSGGGWKTSALIKIELLNLPSSSVSVAPASQAVANGATFTVNMNVNTNYESRGWQMNVNFDASKLTANSVSEGAFLSTWAAAHSCGTVSAGPATIDNVAGTITIPGYAMTGTTAGGAMGTGTLCTISFTAKTGIDNYAIITPASALVINASGTVIAATVTSGTVAIGNVPMPDLVVSSASAVRVSDTTYTVTYTITNQGNLAAGACTTSIVIDSGTPITAACPALAAGASDTQTTAVQTLSGASDTIVVTADSAGVVSESNEGNNTRTITYAAVGDNGGTPINSNIAAKLVLTVPSSIDPWNLLQGSNDITGSANVKCNSNWKLQVSDQDLTTIGHMTKWKESVYASPIVQLASALQAGCDTTATLSGTPQTIATGTPAGQSGNDGQNLTISFHQPVVYADPVLLDGDTYHILVTFTASVTF